MRLVLRQAKPRKGISYRDRKDGTIVRSDSRFRQYDPRAGSKREDQRVRRISATG